MSIWMFRSATPYWVSFYHHKIVAQLGYGWRTPYTEAVLKTVHEDYFALIRGQPQHSGGVAMAATLVMPGKHAKSLSTSCIASPVYDPAEKPRISISLLRPVLPAARWGKLALRRILPWVITPNNLPNSCCPRWVWRSCMAGRIVAAVTRCTA